MNLKTQYITAPKQVKASVWFLICSFLQKGISVITTPIFTRLLSTSEYGQYGVFNSWFSIISVVVSMQLYQGVYTQGLIKFSEERETFSSSLQGLLVTLVFIWSVIYYIFHSFWNALFGLTTVQMLAMFVMIWTSGAFAFWATEQRVILSYKKLVLVTIAVSAAKPLIGIVLVYNADDKVTARILGLAIVETIGYVGLFISQMKKGRVFFSAKNWKYAVCFCIPLIPHYLSQNILNSADRIMIEKMVGSSEAGIYDLAYQLSLLMTLINSAILQTINPWIFQKIKDGNTKDIPRVVYPTLTIVAAANTLLIAIAPELVRFFAPTSYYDAIWIIPPVALSVLFMFEYCLFSDFEFYYEKKSFIATATIMSAGLNIILNWICIRAFGYQAAGYTTLFCYIAYTLGHFLFMKKICRDNAIQDMYNNKLLLVLNGGFILIGFLLLSTYKYPTVRYIFVLIIGLLIIIKKKMIISMIKIMINDKNNTFEELK